MDKVGTIIKQEFNLSGDMGHEVYIQCQGCTETTAVENLDEAVRWADAHEIEYHTESSI